TDWPFDELEPIHDHKIEGRDVVVGKDADKIQVAVSGVGGVVAHPIGENLVGGILDSELLLQAVAATEVHSSPTQDAPAADVVIFIDADDGGSMIACGDGRGEPRDSCSDNNH